MQSLINRTANSCLTLSDMNKVYTFQVLHQFKHGGIVHLNIIHILLKNVCNTSDVSVVYVLTVKTHE